MTTLLDRLTGQKVLLNQLTGPIESGRYLRLDDVPEKLVCGHGAGVIKINDISVACIDHLETYDEVKFQLVIQAIKQIAKLTATENSKMCSPLMPAKLLNNEGQLNELEKYLDSIMKKGHLHEISRNPRMDMRYEEIVQDVSRAKRLASSSHRHLAAHSECWQNRSFTGIQPKRILSRVSEDEYNLYENRVFCRLLDRLACFLSKRIFELEQLMRTLNDALEIEESTSLNYRLRKTLFSVWGETFSADETSAATEQLERTKITLEGLLKKVKHLMHSGIYQEIPKNAQVPARLRPTNILTHDTHYRYLFPLWKTLSEISGDVDLTAEEKCQQQIQLQHDYTAYCGLVVHRALEQLGFFKETKLDSDTSIYITRDFRLEVSQKEGNWLIHDKTLNQTIKLCPIATWHFDNLQTRQTKNSITLPCVLHLDSSPEHPACLLNTLQQGPLQLSPMDFYVEEQMVTLLNAWIFRNIVRCYGQGIPRIPKKVMAFVEPIKEIQTAHHSSEIQVLEPVSNEDRKSVIKALQQENAIQACEQFQLQIKMLDALSYCPLCQSKANFISWEKKTFKGECLNSSCQLVWTLHNQEEQRTLCFKTDKEEDSFQNSGRWVQSISL